MSHSRDPRPDPRRDRHRALGCRVGTTLALAVALTACQPLGDVVTREAAWWYPERVEAGAGVRVIQATGGGPVGRWPRVVIRLDGTYDFDNRAWALSLPERVYDALSRAELDELVIERQGLRGAEVSGLVVPALLDAAAAHADLHKEMAARFDIDAFEGAIALVPEVGVPGLALTQAAYTVAQAEYSGHAVLTREGGHLRVANAPDLDADSCALAASWATVSGAPRISLHHAVPPIAAAGCGPAEPSSLTAPLATLVERCAASWTTEPAHIEPCAALDVLLDGDPADLGLARLSAARSARPAIRIQRAGVAVGTSAAEPCSEVLEVRTLTDDQLTVVCDAARSSAPGGIHRPLFAWRGLSETCATAEQRAAFPRWNAARPQCPPPDDAILDTLRRLSEEIAPP